MADVGMFMLWTILIMATLAGIGVLGGVLIAHKKKRDFMKVFLEDVDANRE